MQIFFTLLAGGQVDYARIEFDEEIEDPGPPFGSSVGGHHRVEHEGGFAHLLSWMGAEPIVDEYRLGTVLVGLVVEQVHFRSIIDSQYLVHLLHRFQQLLCVLLC